SSLLRAGLLPRLAAGGLGPGAGRWARGGVRAGGRPVGGPAGGPAGGGGAGPGAGGRARGGGAGGGAGRGGPGARGASRRRGRGGAAGRGAGAPPRLVLVVDQFEELFTAGEGAGDGAAGRDAFVTALHAAATVPAGPGGLPPALVVVAVRADYLGHLIADPRL